MRLLSLLLAFVATACLTPLRGAMRPSPRPLSLTAAPGKARLLFLRSEHFVGGALSVFYFDGVRGQVLGKSVNDSAFAVDVEPGEYQVCGVSIAEGAWGGPSPLPTPLPGASSRLTKLTVAEGKTYALRVRIGMGPRLEAWPVLPRTPRARVLEEELASLRAVEPVSDASEFVRMTDPRQQAEWFDLCL
ncbi:MAG: hypothetical protein ACOZQL_06655, partial [Myxococcota bacterium]